MNVTQRYENARVIFEETVSAAVDHVKSPLWLGGLISTIAATFLLGMFLANPEMKVELSYIEKLREESISPTRWNFSGALLIALGVVLTCSPRFEKLARFVSSGLLLASISGAAMFGLLLGEIGYWGVQPSDVETSLEVFTIIPILFVPSTLIVVALYCFSAVLNPKSCKTGFLSKWWRIDPILRYGSAAFVLLAMLFAFK